LLSDQIDLRGFPEELKLKERICTEQHTDYILYHFTEEWGFIELCNLFVTLFSDYPSQLQKKQNLVGFMAIV
jgi:cell division protein FtsW (lipid II flippase)